MDKSRGIGISAFIVSLVLIFGCSVNVPDSPTRDFFFFEQPITMTNVKKDYTVGDVVFFAATSADKFFIDTLTNTEIFVGNARFSFLLEMNQLTPLSHPDSAKHELNVVNGVVFNEEDFEFTGSAGVEYGCPEINYQMDFNIQFQEAGYYLMVLNDDPTFVQDIVFMSSSEDCRLLETLPPPDGADLAAVEFYYDVADVNLDVYQQYIIDNGLTENPAVVEALENKIAFFFEVSD